MAKSSQRITSNVTAVTRGIAYARVAVVSGLMTLGCLALMAFTITHWLESYILNTNAWVATVAPLPQAPIVNTALSGYLTGLVFENVNITKEVQNVLPPRAAFVAGPLADQLQSLTTQTVKRVLRGDAFLAIWANANRLAMNRLLTNARSPTPPGNTNRAAKFTLNLSDIKDKLTNRLGATASVLPALSPQSGQPFRVGANLQESRKRLWQYIRTIDFFNVVLPFTLSTAFLGALVLARDRRKTLLVITIVSIVGLLIELIAIKAARQSVLSKVRYAQYRDAVGYVYDTVTAALRTFTIWLLLPGTIVIALCIVAGPARWATSFRKYATHPSALQILLLHWHGLRALARRYQFAAWAMIGLLLLVFLAFIGEIATHTVLRDILVAVSLVELVYLVAHPRPVARL